MDNMALLLWFWSFQGCFLVFWLFLFVVFFLPLTAVRSFAILKSISPEVLRGSAVPGGGAAVELGSPAVSSERSLQPHGWHLGTDPQYSPVVRQGSVLNCFSGIATLAETSWSGITYFWLLKIMLIPVDKCTCDFAFLTLNVPPALQKCSGVGTE